MLVWLRHKSSHKLIAYVVKSPRVLGLRWPIGHVAVILVNMTAVVIVTLCPFGAFCYLGSVITAELSNHYG